MRSKKNEIRKYDIRAGSSVKHTNRMYCLCAAHRTGVPNYLRRVICTDTAVTAGYKRQQIAQELPLEADATFSLSSHPEFRRYHTLDLGKSWPSLRLLLPAFQHHTEDSRRTFCGSHGSLKTMISNHALSHLRVRGNECIRHQTIVSYN